MTAVAHQDGELRQVAKDVWAWVAHSAGWGYSNAGLVRGSRGGLLVDTLYDLRLTRRMLDAMAPVLGTVPLTDALNTHGNGDHCFGNELLPAATRIHAAPEAEGTLRAEHPGYMASLRSADLGPVLGPYVQACFGGFHFEEVTLRLPDTAVTEPTSVDLGGVDVLLLPMGAAHSQGDVVAHIPDAGVLFAGDPLFIGVTPVMWAGPVANWVRACDRLAALDAEVVVPGHGPLTDQAGIARLGPVRSIFAGPRRLAPHLAALSSVAQVRPV
ncbi:MBL fold metallo-hydrolase, partial [Streptomyces sp. NPDC094034]|uniref:MBL fold metallo-hydrolase n=1 Tax=Streptomyces sp. NPDC094034 TaxID=3155309 RepID=UPI003333FF54